MEAYLEKLLSQIRCKKARPYILDEIRTHIESQIEDNLSCGMEYEEAERSAVADMGDPVEVGIALDKIHRPIIAWKLLVIVGVSSLLGMIVQQSIFYKTIHSDLEPYLQETYQASMVGFVSSIILGFIIMSGIYFVDYTVIAKYSKIIGLFIIVMGILRLTGFFGGVENGDYYSIGFGMFRISAMSIMMSIYRYKDVYPKSIKSSQIAIRKSITLSI